MNDTTTHSKFLSLGTIGLILGIIGIVCPLIIFMTITGLTQQILAQILFLFICIGICTVFIGAISYRGKEKDKKGLLSIILGIIIIVIWFYAYIYMGSMIV